MIETITHTGQIAPGRAAPRFALSAPFAVGVWAALIVAVWAWGGELRGDGVRIVLDAAPLFGEWDLQLGVDVLIPLVVGATLVLAGPPLAARLPWRGLLFACVAAAAAWAIALALTEGADGLTEPLEGPSDYLASVPLVHGPGDLLGGFVERIGDFSTHVRSHPPGMVLALFGLDRAGLGGALPAAILIIALAASAAAAALIALRAMAGEASARRAAPFLALAPGAVWIATTADALFMAVGAWAVALIVLAMTARGRRSDALAAGGGSLLGLGCFLSFGIVLLAAIPLPLALTRRRVRPAAIAAAAAGAVVVAFLAAGYWWLDGYQAAREQYAASVASTRPYGFFAVSNLAAFALATGPAIAIAIARLRDRRIGLLVGGVAVAIALADLSGMSKGEVERIWLPFLPWVLLAAAALPAGIGRQRALLAAQAALGLAIQVGVAMTW